MQDTGTLVLIDVVDSTALTERLGDAAMSALWAQHDRTARDLLEHWHGREIDKSDGFLLLFASATDAVGYAGDYHRRLAALAPPLTARAGIHCGPITLRANPPGDVARGAKPLEVEGLAKPVVARVMSLAVGGQTLVTDSVRAALSGGLRVQAHGHWRLKGLDEPVELFEVGDEHAPWTPPPDAAKAFRVLRKGAMWLPAREVRHNLPAERDGFVGRREPLQALARRLDDGARLVSVLGIGGSGKTRLVTHFGWTWMGEFAGGVWFCDLSAARGLDGIAYALAQALDVPLGKGDPVRQLAQAIAGRGPCLVILDNFEQVARHAEQTLGVWLERAPQARFIATTREVLGIVGEETLALAPLREAEAIDLFRQRARAARGSFESDAADAAATVQLVTMLDGLPLAIELAAARVRTMAPRLLLARMHDRFALLRSRSGRQDRQATLRAAFDWSWDLLDEAEKAALAQLSVFPGDFALEAAEAVLQWPPDASALAPTDALQALVEKSFVRLAAEMRFNLFESVREYAAEHLRTSGRYPGSGPAAQLEAEQRHGEHYASVGTVRRPVSAVAEIDNLVIACRRAVARSDAAVAAQTLSGAWTVIAMRGPFRVGLALANAVQAMQLAGKHRVTADLICGFALEKTGRTAEALQHFDAAVQGSRVIDQPEPQARALHRTAVLQARAGELALAQASGDQALALARATGDAALLCGVLNGLGAICDTTSRADAARRHYEEALQIARAAGHQALEGMSAGNLAQWHANQGHLNLARPLYAQAIAQTRAVGSRQWEANTRCNLGLLHQTEGRLDEAHVELETARTVAQDLGDVRLLAFVRCNLGLLAEARGDTARASVWHADAAALAREQGDRRFEGLCLTYLGRVKARRDEAADATEALDRAEALLRAAGDRTGLAIARCVRAETEHRAGRPPQARQALADAEALAAELAPVDTASELGKALELTQVLLATPAAAAFSG